jgi:hypothetical protein
MDVAANSSQTNYGAKLNSMNFSLDEVLQK